MKRYLFITLLLITLCTSSCLLPPPGRVEAEINHPPTVLSSESAPLQGAVELNMNCKFCAFRLQSDDADSQDTHYVRWFIDYDLSAQRDIVSASELAPPYSGTAKRVASRYVLDLQQRFVSNALGEVHVVEAVVSDRPFNADPYVTPTNQAVTTPGQLARYRWLVKLARTGNECIDPQSICFDEVK